MSDTNKVVNDLMQKHGLGDLNVMQKRAVRALCYDYEMWLGPPPSGDYYTPKQIEAREETWFNRGFECGVEQERKKHSEGEE